MLFPFYTVTAKHLQILHEQSKLRDDNLQRR